MVATSPPRLRRTVRAANMRRSQPRGRMGPRHDARHLRSCAQAEKGSLRERRPHRRQRRDRQPGRQRGSWVAVRRRDASRRVGAAAREAVEGRAREAGRGPREADSAAEAGDGEV